MSEPTVLPPDAYTDSAGVAAHLGVTRATLIGHLRNLEEQWASGVTDTWLPRPTRIAGRWLWRTSDLDWELIEQRRPRRGNPHFGPGYHPPRRTADSPADTGD